MGDLTKHFSRSEFACRCGCGADDVDMGLVHGLESLRQALSRPITVTSGVRCIEHNRAVGGARDSYHVQGMAADIVAPGITAWDLFEAAVRLDRWRWHGLGLYPEKGFIHLDVRGYRSRWVR